MFRELHLTWAAVQPDGVLNSVARSRGYLGIPGACEVPVPPRDSRPFVEAGPSFRTAGNLNVYGTNPAHFGFTTCVGVENNLRGSQDRPRRALHTLDFGPCSGGPRGPYQ